MSIWLRIGVLSLAFLSVSAAPPAARQAITPAEEGNGCKWGSPWRGPHGTDPWCMPFASMQITLWNNCVDNCRWEAFAAVSSSSPLFPFRFGLICFDGNCQAFGAGGFFLFGNGNGTCGKVAQWGIFSNCSPVPHLTYYAKCEVCEEEDPPLH
jgi:hypothetical protein